MTLITNPTVPIDALTFDADADVSPVHLGYLVTQSMLMRKNECRIDIYAKLREYCIHEQGL